MTQSLQDILGVVLLLKVLVIRGEQHLHSLRQI